MLLNSLFKQLKVPERVWGEVEMIVNERFGSADVDELKKTIADHREHARACGCPACRRQLELAQFDALLRWSTPDGIPQQVMDIVLKENHQ